MHELFAYKTVGLDHALFFPSETIEWKAGARPFSPATRHFFHLHALSIASDPRLNRLALSSDRIHFARAPVLLWWGRWDLNPGSPAPQAGILDQSSRLATKIPAKRLLDYDPKQTELIVNTLLALKNNGKAENTVNANAETQNIIAR